MLSPPSFRLAIIFAARAARYATRKTEILRENAAFLQFALHLP